MSKICGAAGWGHYKCPLPGPLHPRPFPPSARSRMNYRCIDLFGSFWTLLDHFATLTRSQCLAIFGQNRAIFGLTPTKDSGPQSKIRFITVSHMWSGKSFMKIAHQEVSKPNYLPLLWPAEGKKPAPFRPFCNHRKAQKRKYSRQFNFSFILRAVLRGQNCPCPLSSVVLNCFY